MQVIRRFRLAARSLANYCSSLPKAGVTFFCVTGPFGSNEVKEVIMLRTFILLLCPAKKVFLLITVRASACACCSAFLSVPAKTGKLLLIIVSIICWTRPTHTQITNVGNLSINQSLYLPIVRLHKETKKEIRQAARTAAVAQQSWPPVSQVWCSLDPEQQYLWITIISKRVQTSCFFRPI